MIGERQENGDRIVSAEHPDADAIKHDLLGLCDIYPPPARTLRMNLGAERAVEFHALVSLSPVLF